MTRNCGINHERVSKLMKISWSRRMDIVPRVFLSASLSRCLPGASSDNLATLSRLNDLATGIPYIVYLRCG